MKITSILYDKKRRLSLREPSQESRSSAETRQLEISDGVSRRVVFVYIRSLRSAIERARELFNSRLSAIDIAEELEDEFEVEPNKFTCVRDIDPQSESFAA